MNASRSLSAVGVGVPTGAWRWAALGFVLLALGAAGSGKGSLGWLYTGMAIRMAQEMKMNVDYEDLPLVDKPLGWIERETRRRIWWSCFTMVGY